VRLIRWLQGCDYDTRVVVVAAGMALGEGVAALLMLIWR
jgi:hypothetical protein